MGRTISICLVIVIVGGVLFFQNKDCKRAAMDLTYCLRVAKEEIWRSENGIETDEITRQCVVERQKTWWQR